MDKMEVHGVAWRCWSCMEWHVQRGAGAERCMCKVQRDVMEQAGARRFMDEVHGGGARRRY